MVDRTHEYIERVVMCMTDHRRNAAFEEACERASGPLSYLFPMGLVPMVDMRKREWAKEI